MGVEGRARRTVLRAAVLAVCVVPATAGAALALTSGTTFKGHTSQSATQTGQHNDIEFRVSSSAKRLDFVGVTNVVGNHCVDTLSDAKNAKQGLGHRAPDPKIHRDGTFSGSNKLVAGGTTLHTRISGKVGSHGKRLTGSIDEHQGPTATLPAGCDVSVSFSAKRK